MDAWVIVVILGLVIIGYALMQPKGEKGKNSGTFTKDMEEALEQFALEMGEENKQILNHILEYKRQHEQQTEQLRRRVEHLEERQLTYEKMLEHMTEQAAKRTAETNRLDGASGHRNGEAEDAGHDKHKITAAPAALQRSEAQFFTAQTAPAAEKSKSASIGDRYRALFELHSQGKSVEQIAKRLSMNKGEVQLIMKLARQEEQLGV